MLYCMSDFSLETKPTTEHQPSEVAQKVLHITEKAGLVLMKYFKKDLTVNFKKDEFDPVTVADRESDDLIRKEIQTLFPDDFLLSEENDSVPESYIGRVWMIDPLNGTKSFIRGSDTFGIVIGLVENGIPVFGCVAVPAQQKVFYAEKGKGAFEKIGERFEQLHTTQVAELEKSRLITREPSKDIRPIEEKLNQLPFLQRIEEGSGAKLCTIASGEAEAHINTNFRAGKWDIAAGQLILEEAGGVVTDLDGEPIDYTVKSVGLERSFVASANKELHSKIIDGLTKLGV